MTRVVLFDISSTYKGADICQINSRHLAQVDKCKACSSLLRVSTKRGLFRSFLKIIIKSSWSHKIAYEKDLEIYIYFYLRKLS